MHLAVTDVMYKNPASQQNELEDNSMQETDLDSVDEDSHNQDEEDDKDIEMTENFILEEFLTDDLLPDISCTFKETVKDIREIVKTFRHERNCNEFL